MLPACLPVLILVELDVPILVVVLRGAGRLSSDLAKSLNSATPPDAGRLSSDLANGGRQRPRPSAVSARRFRQP